MKISIIGTGYVGLPTACAFAKWGNKVTCLDINQEKIKQLQQGIPTIYEKGLDKLLLETKDKIKFTTNYNDIKGSDFIILAVGTPMSENGEANLSYIIDAVKSINNVYPNALIVVKSTVPVGTCAKLNKYIPKGKIASMPEFLREGFALDDIFNPDRIIIGTPEDNIFNTIESAYPQSMKDKIHRIKTTESSELIKYASNAFLAIKIHYINEIANLCERTGADVNDVAYGMGLDSRIGNKFLQAGCGYGGSCFPKDTNAIYALAETKGIDLSLVGTAINGNRKRQRNIAYDINTIHNKKSKLSVLGLAFKAGTDDVRESPAINIINNLDAKIISVYDPKAMDNAKKTITNKNVIFSHSMEDCIYGANTIVIATDWQEFNNIYNYIKPQTTIIDLKNMLNRDKILLLQANYKGIGR